MTQRQIDLALLAGIGLLLVAILVLALSAAPTPGRRDIVNPLGGGGPATAETQAAPTAPAPATHATTSPTTSSTSSPATTPAPGSTPDAAQGAGGNTSTAPGTTGEGLSADAPEGSSDAASAGTATGVGPQSTTESTAGEPGASAPTAAAPSPAGAVTAAAPGATASGRPLERVGFAFVTGSAGACGVPLQPWQHVAVSRDLLDRYGCGATVEVTLSESVAGRERVVAQIGDTMGAEITRTVNIFVASDEPALEYGVIEGRLQPVGSP